MLENIRPYYEHAGITIYHGDCRDVLRGFTSESADTVITDPPYLVSYRGRWGSEWGIIEGDTEASWLSSAFLEVWRVLNSDALCLSFYGWPHADTFLGAWKLIGFRPVSQVVCIKDSIGLGHYSRAQHESAYLLAKGSPKKIGPAISDVFDWEREPVQVHPNQKPLSTMTRLVRAYTAEGCCVLDPFMGSGSTLIAAKKLGLRAVGIEIEERYCEIAAQRLAQELFDFGPTPEMPTQLELAPEPR